MESRAGDGGPAPASGGGLRREISLGSAVATVAGQMIAVGIFLTPAGMIKSIGSPLWLLVVWSVMGVMALSGAFCYGDLAGRFPQAGGGYVYLRETYGRPLSFLYGWMCLLVMDPGITAALAVGMASYAGYIFPLAPAGVKIVAIAAIVMLAAANILGIRLAAGLMRWLTLGKLGSLAFIAIWGLGLRLGNWGNFIPFAGQQPGSAPLPAALAGGMVAAFFSFGGWWDVSKIAGEVRDPERTLPRALTLGILAVTAAYILVTAVFLYLVPAGHVTSDETFAAQAGEVLFGRAGGRVLSGIVVVSVLGSLAGLIMTAPRVYYAMARDGVFPAAISRVHLRFGTPARAIALQAVLASVLVALGGFSQIIAYFIFVTVIFIALTVAAVFVSPGKTEAPRRIPGFPVTPMIFLSLVAVLLVLLATANPKQSILGVLVVALGIPVYYFYFRKEQKT
jgi:basic amino acid/polyamine antiporter, APA family